MADDIVNRLRLRAAHAYDYLSYVAADEIEQLRSLLDGVDNLHRKIWAGTDELCDQCKDLWPCVTHVFLHPEEG